MRCLPHDPGLPLRSHRRLVELEIRKVAQICNLATAMYRKHPLSNSPTMPELAKPVQLLGVDGLALPKHLGLKLLCGPSNHHDAKLGEAQGLRRCGWILQVLYDPELDPLGLLLRCSLQLLWSYQPARTLRTITSFVCHFWLQFCWIVLLEGRATLQEVDGRN